MTVYRHKKRKTVYVQIGLAELQTSSPLNEGAEIVIYQESSGKIWARPIEEFFDGRFEEVK